MVLWPSGGVSPQEELRGLSVGLGVLMERVCVISNLLGTLGLAVPSPASVQDMERDVGLGKGNREKIRVGLSSSILGRDSISHAKWVGWENFYLPKPKVF